MKRIVPFLAAVSLLSGCASYPTLTEVSQHTHAATGQKIDQYSPYQITDFDVLVYSEQIKKSLGKRFSSASFTRYGSSATQLTLATLAGSAQTLGWSAGTASGLALGSAYIFTLGQLIDAKGHAQAYEQAFAAIEGAEANFFFHQVGGQFKKDPDTGRNTVDATGAPKGGVQGIPSNTALTLDGETLYYRIGKTLKVLNDVLNSKIPDLQDLKEAKGDASASVEAPLRPNDKRGGIANNSGERRAPAAETVRTTTNTTHSTTTSANTGTASATATDIHAQQKQLIMSADQAPPEKVQAALKLAPPDFDPTGDPKKRLHVLISKTSDPAALGDLEAALK